MKSKRSRILGAIFAVLLLTGACGSSDGEGSAEGSIVVEDARYRLSRADLGAGYLSLTNRTDAVVTLQGASAPGVGRIELHESLSSDDGVMSMVPRPEGFVIDPGETVVLEPGGKHLMIFDPAGTDDITVTLDFGDETIDVLATYDADASAGATDEMDMDHSDMDMDHSDMDMDDAE